MTKPRIGDLMCFRKDEAGWRLGLVCGVGEDVEVIIRELGSRKTFTPARGNRMLVCRTITGAPELVRRYKAASLPFADEAALRTFVLPHTPYAATS